MDNRRRRKPVGTANNDDSVVTLLDVGDEFEHLKFGPGFVTGVGVTESGHPGFSAVFGKDFDLGHALPVVTLSPQPPSEEVSRRMSAQKRSDTVDELALRRALFSYGLRYRVQYRPDCLKGTRRSVDIAFTKRKVAVFVDGCFWHGCPKHFKTPKSNSGWWEAKIAANRARDADTDRRLREAGWDVIRVWSHDLIDEMYVDCEAQDIGVRVLGEDFFESEDEYRERVAREGEEPTPILRVVR